MLRLRPIVLTALTATACLGSLPAASAEAAKWVAYDVTFNGSGSFSNTRAITSESGSKFTWKADVAATFEGKISTVRFVDGRLDDAETRGDVTVRPSGTISTTVVNKQGTSQETCTAAGEAAGMSGLELDLDTPLDGSEALFLRASDTIDAEWECKGDPLGTDAGDATQIDIDTGDGPLDAAFRLPREAIGQGKIIQLVEGPPEHSQQKCPGDEGPDGRTTSCSGSWSGQVVFTKVGEGVVQRPSDEIDSGDDLIGPLPPAPKPPVDSGDDLIAPLVPAPKPPIDDGDDLIAPLVPAKATVGAGAKTVSFKAGCGGGCTGTATFAAAGGGARAAAKPRPLATLRFRVAAGPPRTVKLTLPAKARRALRRTGKASMVVTLKPNQGAAKRTRLALALPR